MRNSIRNHFFFPDTCFLVLVRGGSSLLLPKVFTYLKYYHVLFAPVFGRQHPFLLLSRYLEFKPKLKLPPGILFTQFYLMFLVTIWSKLVIFEGFHKSSSFEYLIVLPTNQHKKNYTFM